MVKTKHIGIVAFITVAVIAVAAPFYLLFMLLKRGTPLKADAAYYGLSQTELETFSKTYPRYLSLSRLNDENFASGIARTVSGDFDQRSDAGKRAQAAKRELEGLQPVVDEMMLKPRMMFDQAVWHSASQLCAMVALTVFAVAVLIQPAQHFIEAGKDELMIASYLIGGIASLVVFFIARPVVQRLLHLAYRRHQPDVVSLDTLRAHQPVNSAKPEAERPVSKPQQTKPGQHRFDSLDPALIAVDRRQALANAAVYYCAPSVFVGMMDDNKMDKEAVKVIFADLVAKGWKPQQVKALLSGAMKMYGSHHSVEKMANRCKRSLSEGLIRESMQTAFFVANVDGSFSREERGMLEGFLSEFSLTADDVLTDRVAS